MPWVLLCVMWTILPWTVVDAINLPKIEWTLTNPMFKTSNNDHVIEVNLDDEIDFVCPHHPPSSTSTSASSINISKPERYLIYEVSKDSYNLCKLSSPRSMIVNCSNPARKKTFTLIFERFSSIPQWRDFKAGESYYYITTSTGTAEGLDNQQQGACLNYNMKVTIRVKSLPTLPPSTTTTTRTPSTESTTSMWLWLYTSIAPTQYWTNKTPWPEKEKEKPNDKDNDNSANEINPAKEGSLVSGANIAACSLTLLIGVLLSWTLAFSQHR